MQASSEDLQEMSLRIKYEGLAKVTSALSKARSFQEVAETLQSNLKFIFNFSRFRIILFYEQEQLQFELTRQTNEVSQGVLNIFRTEVEVLSARIPKVMNLKDLTEEQKFVHPLFHPPAVQSLCLYPLYVNERQQMLIAAGNREDVPPVESDYRFLGMIGDYIFSKCSELVLTSRLEEMVNKRTTQLNTANKELSNLFYRASHDFSSPLKTILGLAEVSRLQTFQPNDAQELYGRMVDVVDTTQKMLHKLKLISEVESEVRVVGKIHIPDLLKRVVGHHRPGPHIKLNTAYSGDTEIVANESVVITLLDNLIENSIQFHRNIPDAYINISTEVMDSYLTIVVEDNGQGIEQSHIKSIFDLYSRSNPNSKGNGLGLYLVKRILEYMNGTVRVTSHVDEGTRFELHIPL